MASPSPRSIGPNLYLNTVLDRAIHGIQGLGTADAANSFIDGVAAGVQADFKQLEVLASAFANGLSADRRIKIHTDVGRAAVRSTVRAYRSEVTARKRVPSYREGKGRFPKALGRALDSDNMFRATQDGLAFGNTTWLNGQAQHWARLNFGALPRGQGGQRAFGIAWEDAVVAEFGFNEGPRGPVLLPPGKFLNIGDAPGGFARYPTSAPGVPSTSPQRKGQFAKTLRTNLRGGELSPGAFFPMPSSKPFTKTRGIAARRFLDKGLEAIADRLPRAYDDLYQEIFEENKHATVGTLYFPSPRPGHGKGYYVPVS